MYISPKATPATEILAGCVAVWKNIWADHKKTIDLIETELKNEDMPVKWVKAQVGANEGVVNPKIRSNYNLSLTNAGYESEILRVIANNIYEMIESCGSWYKANFRIEEPLFPNEHLVALKYSTGEEYKSHYDGGTISKRVISPILYLNDDYEGGYLEFTNFNLKLKPAAGDFYIFPASFPYTHIAHPVTSGTKYAVVTWLHDQPN